MASQYLPDSPKRKWLMLEPRFDFRSRGRIEGCVGQIGQSSTSFINQEKAHSSGSEVVQGCKRLDKSFLAIHFENRLGLYNHYAVVTIPHRSVRIVGQRRPVTDVVNDSGLPLIPYDVRRLLLL